MYEDKNTTANTRGNEEIDKLLVVLELNGVLSEKFNKRIMSIVYWILTNHKEYIQDIKLEINKLKEEMKWLNMFNKDFIDLIYYSLYYGLEKQILLEEQKKYNL